MKKDYRNLPIPDKYAGYNSNDVLIWDIKLLSRIANDLNRSLGLDPPIKVLPAKQQDKKSMETLKDLITQAILLTNE